MKSDRDDRVELAPGEAQFVEKLADAYAPEPLTAEERVAFTAALEARLERRRRTRRLVPALAGALAVAAVAWLAIPGPPAPTARPAAGPSLAASAGDIEAGLEAAQWGLDLLGSDTLLEDGLLEPGLLEPGLDAAGDPLPDEYLAIASVFLDG